MAVSLGQRLTQPPPRLSTRWGVWRLDAERLVLIHTSSGYEVDLEDIDKSSAMLDWIFQVQRWATAQDLADLLQALADIFNPQANLSSGGGDARIEDPTRFLRDKIRTP